MLAVQSSLWHFSRAAFCLRWLSIALAVLSPEKWTQGSQGQLRVFPGAAAAYIKVWKVSLCSFLGFYAPLLIARRLPLSHQGSLEVHRKVVHAGSLEVREAWASVCLVCLLHLQRVDRTAQQGKLKAWNVCRVCGGDCQSHRAPSVLPTSVPYSSVALSASLIHAGSESFLVLFEIETSLQFFTLTNH